MKHATMIPRLWGKWRLIVELAVYYFSPPPSLDGCNEQAALSLYSGSIAWVDTVHATSCRDPIISRLVLYLTSANVRSLSH